MAVLRVKDGVEFTIISPGGFVILAELLATALALDSDLTITSACDGVHSGPLDPHHLGKAYDIRTHDQPDPNKVLVVLQQNLEARNPDRFFAFLEDPGTENEHIHAQQKKDTIYP